MHFSCSFSSLLSLLQFKSYTNHPGNAALSTNHTPEFVWAHHAIFINTAPPTTISIKTSCQAVCAMLNQARGVARARKDTDLIEKVSARKHKCQVSCVQPTSNEHAAFTFAFCAPSYEGLIRFTLFLKFCCLLCYGDWYILVLRRVIFASRRAAWQRLQLLMGKYY